MCVMARGGGGGTRGGWGVVGEKLRPVGGERSERPEVALAGATAVAQRRQQTSLEDTA